MIAIPLYDLLARDDGAHHDPRRAEQAARFARVLVGSALTDWQRVLECEEQFTSAEYVTPASDDEVNRLLYAMYEKWAAEAEQVLDRVRRLGAHGHRVEDAELLEDAYCRATARLKLTPAKIARATEQARLGQTVPLKELRDELRGRHRA